MPTNEVCRGRVFLLSRFYESGREAVWGLGQKQSNSPYKLFGEQPSLKPERNVCWRNGADKVRVVLRVDQVDGGFGSGIMPSGNPASDQEQRPDENGAGESLHSLSGRFRVADFISHIFQEA